MLSLLYMPMPVVLVKMISGVKRDPRLRRDDGVRAGNIAIPDSSAMSLN